MGGLANKKKSTPFTTSCLLFSALSLSQHTHLSHEHKKILGNCGAICDNSKTFSCLLPPFSRRNKKGGWGEERAGLKLMTPTFNNGHLFYQPVLVVFLSFSLPDPDPAPPRPAPLCVKKMPRNIDQHLLFRGFFPTSFS